MDFHGLAPTSLRNSRPRRYLGDDMCLPLLAFVAPDQERIRSLYKFLGNLLAAFDRGGECRDETLREIAAIASVSAISKIMSETRQLGLQSAEANPTELFATTVHDIRGGGLSLLLARLQFAHQDGWKIESARTIFFLTRDHLKIMRNALLGLDDAKREEDLQPKLHGTGFIVEKWQNALLVGGERQTRLKIESEFDGNIAECCVEFGALDRILYNLINNACRHTAEDIIRLFILKMPSEKVENLRFVLTNRLSATDAESLTGQNMKDLFKPGVSTTKSGFGLTVAADFVANAYGLISRNKALEGGYIGATVIEDQFIAWFHWPIAGNI